MPTTAPAVQVFGPAKVWIGITDTMYPLGFTRNGVDQTEEAFWLDVPGDEHGGDDGPPIDIQFLGEIVRVRCELTKWNITSVNIVRARVNSTTGGQGRVNCLDIGSLMIASGRTIQLRIIPACLVTGSVYYVYDFLRVIPRAPIEINHATKFATVVTEFECHRNPSLSIFNPGVIYTHTQYTYPAGPSYPAF